MSVQNVRIKALEDIVNDMSRSTPSGEAIHFKPGDKAWQWLNNGDFIVRVSLREMQPSGSGTKLPLSIQNPLSIDLRDCKISVAWASTDSAGAVVENTRHAEEFNLSETFPAGAFTFPDVTLSDLPPAKIGFLMLSKFWCERTSS